MASREAQNPARGDRRAAARNLAIGLCLTLLAADAAAYIDPGYGALVQQLILSGILGALFLARRGLSGLARRLARPFSGTREAGVAGKAPEPAGLQEPRNSDVR
jgi:hypothetical protein